MRVIRSGKVVVAADGILVSHFQFDCFGSHWDMSSAAMRWAIKMLENELARRERGGSGEKEILEHEIDPAPRLEGKRRALPPVTIEGEKIDE